MKGIGSAAAISEGERNYYVLLKDGHVLSWGMNDFGQAGLGVLGSEFMTPQPVRKSIGVFVDGKEVEIATPPLIVQCSTYVPLRGVFENMGASLTWDTKTRSATATKGAVTVVLNTLTGQMTVNGKVVASEQKPVSVNDGIFVPLRLISEALGAKVEWDEAGYAVRIAQ